VAAIIHSETAQTVLFVSGIAIPAVINVSISFKIQWKLEDVQILLGGRAWTQDWEWLKLTSILHPDRFILPEDPPNVAAAKRELVEYRKKMSKWAVASLAFGGASLMSAFILRLASGL
jgi:hypothetical protein